MGRKARVKRQNWYRRFMRGDAPKHGRKYLRIMQWAHQSGYADLLGWRGPKSAAAKALGMIFSVPKGAIAYQGDIHVNKSRKVLAGRLNSVAYGSAHRSFDHRFSRHLPLRMVDCFPHLSRKMLKTMPRGQAFARIVELENNAND